MPPTTSAVIFLTLTLGVLTFVIASCLLIISKGGY
jgi:hypothetical protein